MIEQIHIHQRVEKDIEQMENLDNYSAVACGRARAIISALREGRSMALAGLLSKSKDARIKNLFKYNLGKGYRLVTIKEKKQMFILFIGDHDQCDRWLDTNRKKKPHLRPVPMNIYPVRCCSPAAKGTDLPLQHPDECCEEDNSEIFPPISQKDLRRVFRGLISGSGCKSI